MWRQLATLLLVMALALSGCAAVCQALRGVAAQGPNSDQPRGNPTPQPQPSVY